MAEDLPRFFLEPGALSADELELAGAAAHHLGRVLRARVGDRFYALDGQGTLAEVEIMALAPGRIRGRIRMRQPATGELPQPLELAMALTRGEKFEWLLQKATELGVSRIRPLFTARSVVRLEGDRAIERRERWQLIVREAAEQCERGRVPTVELPVPWHAALAGATGLQLVGLEREDAPPLRTLLAGLSAGPVTVWIGPEGGWTPAEREGLLAGGVQAIRLGARVLRAETAALSALAQLAAWLEAP